MRSLLFFLPIASLLAACNQSPTQTDSIPVDIEKKITTEIEKEIDSLLAIMTFEEKVGQLNMYSGSWEFTGPVPADNSNQEKAENIKSGRVGGMLNVLTAKGTREAQRMAVENSRLGIPLIFGYDVIHGYKTMFPVPLAQAASWDIEVARKGSQVAAREAAASGLHWTFSPMIDVSRDGRWGRIMEGAGEDPYLTSIMAKGWIEGYQGDDLSDLGTIAACAKHFAGYGFGEAGREYNTVDISSQTLYNVVFPPFKAAVDAGVATFMNAFNDLNGIPATGNAFLLRDILKGEWGYDGMVVSDWASIAELVTHGYVPDKKEAGLAALTAGSDMDMESRIYERELSVLAEEGRLDTVLLNDAVRRILRLKFKLGLFDDPYRYSDEERERTSQLTPEHMEAARDAGRKSIVLLKNEGNLLPLSKNVKSVAVIGQLADSKDVPLGSWRAQAVTNSAVSLLEGVKYAVANQRNVKFELGYTLTKGSRDFIHELTLVEGDRSGFAKAIALAKKSEVVILALGEDCFQSGEGRSQVDIGLKSNQEELLMELLKVNKKVVVVLMNGRPLAIPEVAKKAPAILETWFLGSQAGNAIADVLFGDYNPTGKLPVSFPYHVGQEPLHYDKKNTGRPVTNAFDDGLVFWSHYTDSPVEALYPFGFGLSYTTFSYDTLQVEINESIVNVTMQISNTGKIAGTETVQVYIRDLYATETQPIKKLVDFQQVSLAVGESKTLKFTLDKSDLGFFHSDGSFYPEDGAFKIMVGGNSRDLKEQEVHLYF